VTSDLFCFCALPFYVIQEFVVVDNDDDNDNYGDDCTTELVTGVHHDLVFELPDISYPNLSVSRRLVPWASLIDSMPDCNPNLTLTPLLTLT